MLKSKKKIRYRDFALGWLEKRKGFIKESTYANYMCIIQNHLIPEIGNYYLSEIDNELLQEFIVIKCRSGRLDGGGGLANKTIRDIVSVLKLSMKYAMKGKLIEYIDLDFYYPSSNIKGKLYIFSKNEQKKIIDYTMDRKNGKDIGILLSLYTGLRIGEICALKWGDINFKRNVLIVSKTIQRIYVKNGKNSGKSKIIITSPKTKNANRTIPINSEFARILKELRKNDDYYVLSSKDKYVEPRTFRKYYYKVLRELEINKMNFHSLRHTFASNCIRLGCDYKTVSELLGHSSINITLNIYVHSQLSQKKKCINTVYKDLMQ